jgi:hypothetical protein
MALVVKEEKTFEPAPEGVRQAVCCDVVDLGLRETEFQGQKRNRHVVKFVFQIPDRGENGRRLTVSQQFTLTFNDRGKLRPFVESVLGRKLDRQELRDGFDLENLLGLNVMVQIVHVAVGDRTFANIASAQPFLTKYGEPLEVEDYTRQCDRDQEAGGARQVRLWK